MTKKTITIIVAVILIGVISAAKIISCTTNVDDVKKERQQIINKDSLAREIEKKILDSIGVRIGGLESRIKQDSIDLRKLRIQNDRLEKLYRNIDLSDRPEF